ncbi:MAG: DUF559 domain-containing protein [Planctomycetes bacterium]|nr:DUF559 domain-containing protein [Planctomycetota bacterium]
MNTLELSEVFDIEHRNILRLVRPLSDGYEFPFGSVEELKYTSKQNKELSMFELSDDVVRYLISTKRSFRSTAKRVQVCSLILERMNTPHKVVIGEATRQETKFGILLDEFFGEHLNIIPQYHIGGYFVDFYIPSCNIAIEYDERHHNTKAQKEKDKEREKAVTKLLVEMEGDDNASVTWIRVDEGFEILGLRKIMGALLYDDNYKSLDYLGFSK